MSIGKRRGGKMESPKLGKRQRTSLEKASDRTQITRLRLRYRKSISEIADTINGQYQALGEYDPDTGKLQPTIGVKMVERILQQRRKEFVQQETDEIHAARLEMIRRYEDLALQCQERFDATLVSRVTETEQESDKSGETTSLTKTVRVNTDGQVAYLNLKQICLDRIAELRAIVPPKKIAPTNPEGTEAYRFEDSVELRRLRAFAVELKVFDAQTKELLPIPRGNK